MTGNRATSEIDSALMRLWHMNKSTATTTEAAWVLSSSCEALGLPWQIVVRASTERRWRWVRLARATAGCHRGPLAPTNSPVDQPRITVSLTAGGSSSLEVEHLLFYRSFCPISYFALDSHSFSVRPCLSAGDTFKCISINREFVNVTIVLQGIWQCPCHTNIPFSSIDKHPQQSSPHCSDHGQYLEMLMILRW